MVGFGLLGYAMKKLKYPIVPLILAMVLGNWSRSPSARPWYYPPEVLMSSTLGRSRPGFC